MALPRPNFVVQSNRLSAPCDVCADSLDATWSMKTFIGATPVTYICAHCATAIAKVVIATPEAHDLIDLDERRHLSQALKGSHTQSLVKQHESDEATVRRLLS